MNQVNKEFVLFHKLKIELSLTTKCNYKCSYCCSVDLNPKDKKYLEMDESIILPFLKRILLDNKDKNISILLSGGEPTLYSNFVNFVENINNLKTIKNFNLILITNSTRLDEIEKSLKMIDNILISIHPEYIDDYLSKTHFLKKITEKYNCSFSFLISQNKDKEYLEKYKKLIREANIKKGHIQFITHGYNDINYINLTNINSVEKILNINHELFSEKDTIMYHQYLKTIYQSTQKQEIYCSYRPILILPNNDVLFDCGNYNFIGNIKNIKDTFKILKTIKNINKPIKCTSKCNPQSSGYSLKHLQIL